MPAAVDRATPQTSSGGGFAPKMRVRPRFCRSASGRPGRRRKGGGEDMSAVVATLGVMLDGYNPRQDAWHAYDAACGVATDPYPGAQDMPIPSTPSASGPARRP